MTKEIIAIIIAAVLLFFTHREGQKSGAKKEKVKGLEVKEGMLNEIAEKDLEIVQSKPILDRLAAIRDRIRRRQGDGD
jgi:hypothetical protein